jgi:manganese-dependent inorganic pyrophosphatase
MNKKSDEGNFNTILLLLTDILNEGSQILVVSENMDVVENTFNVKIENNTAFLPGVLSRKKQVIPPITNYITTK